MQTRSVLDVRTVVVVASFVALASLAVWSVALWVTSSQSLQNQMNDLIAEKNTLQTQVTSLQNQVTSLNTLLAEKQAEIEDLEILVTVYRKNIMNLIERLYTRSGGVSAGTNVQ